MKRAAFISGATASAIAAPERAEATCPFPVDKTIFNTYFKPFTDCRTSFQGRVPQVFQSGNGPGVIVLHELGGAGPTLFAFAHRIATRGFTVYVPILFGTPNHEASRVGTLANAVRICISREFSCLRAGESSPVVEWVCSLAKAVHTAHPSYKGIGVVGLCLTGNFALAMAGDPHILAPVVSEPALPFAIKSDLRSDLGLSGSEITSLSARLKEGLPIAVFRFDGDPIVPVDRMQRLEALVSSCGSTMFGNYRIPPTCHGAHAVFTDDFNTESEASRQALSQLIGFLQARLS